MLLRKAYRFKLMVNHPDTAARLLQFSGCTRFVWNKMLAMNLYRLEHKQALLWYQEMAFWLTLWKSSDEYAFLRDCYSQVLQQSMKHLDRAFKDALVSNVHNAAILPVTTDAVRLYSNVWLVATPRMPMWWQRQTY